MAAQYTLNFAEDALVLEAPLLRGSSSVMRVSLDAETRKARVALEARSSALEHSASRTMSVYAILGVVELFRGPYLGVVTRARAVVRNGPGGAEICQVMAADFFPVPRPAGAPPAPPLSPLQHRLEGRFLDMLHSVVDTRALYFSHNYDITQTAQRIALINQRFAGRTPEVKIQGGGFWESPRGADGGPLFTDERSLASRADPRFFWNLEMSRVFADARLDDWVHPVICGYVAVRHHVPVSDCPGLGLTYLFISRRSRARQGTRFNLRGLDAEGNAANFVETEQILLPQISEAADQAGPPPWRADVALCSFVQTRGSIPTSWTQKVTTKYMPRVALPAQAEGGYARFRKHFTGASGQHSLEHYGKAVCINLVDRSGKGSTVNDQRSLGDRYEQHCADLADARLRLIWFDFHHECRKGKYENLSKLVDMVREELKDFGFFVQLRNGRVAQWQSGIFRTNCMDSLDRTAVVQTVLSRRHVLATLDALAADDAQRESLPHASAEAADDVMNLPYPTIERALQEVNRANANTMSVLYAGTPALKTRRGKLGKLQDGLNSVTRYFINNFRDAGKQDAVHLFLGEFSVSSLGKTEDVFARDPGDETLASVASKLAFVFLAVFMLGSMLGATTPSATIATAVVTTAALAVSVIAHALRKGLSPAFVSKPRFIRAADL